MYIMLQYIPRGMHCLYCVVVVDWLCTVLYRVVLTENIVHERYVIGHVFSKCLLLTAVATLLPCHHSYNKL